MQTSLLASIKPCSWDIHKERNSNVALDNRIPNTPVECQEDFNPNMKDLNEPKSALPINLSNSNIIQLPANIKDSPKRLGSDFDVTYINLKSPLTIPTSTAPKNSSDFDFTSMNPTSGEDLNHIKYNSFDFNFNNINSKSDTHKDLHFKDFCLKKSLREEILINLKSRSENLAIIWLNVKESFSLIPIPFLSGYGIWSCWSDRGLCFLLSISENYTTKSEGPEPFLLLGLHSYKGKYFRELSSFDLKANVEVLPNKIINGFSDECSSKNIYSNSLNSQPTYIPHYEVSNPSIINCQDPCMINTEEYSSITYIPNQINYSEIPSYTEINYSKNTNSNNPNTLNNTNRPFTRSIRPTDTNISSLASNTKLDTQSRKQSSNLKVKVNPDSSSKSIISLEELESTYIYLCPKNNKLFNLSCSWDLIFSLRIGHMKPNKRKNCLKSSSNKEYLLPMEKSEIRKVDKLSKRTTWEYYTGETTSNILDEKLGIPVVLLEECEALAGAKKSSSIRCNISLANHRVNAALNNSYRVSIFSPKTIPSYNDEVKAPLLENDNEELNKSDLIQIDDSLQVPEGTIVKIEYPNEYPGYFEEDLITIYNRETIRKCLNKVVEMCEEGADLSPMNLGQVSYRLFWCLTLLSHGKIELMVEELVPTAPSKRFRRKCPWIQEISKSIHEKRLRREKYIQKFQLNEQLRQQELEYRFVEMSKCLDQETLLKKKRRQELQSEQELKFGKKYRHPPLQDCDEKSIIEAVIDEPTGIFKRPLSTLTESQKRYIYQECIRQKLSAPIKLTRIKYKGRGVLAADFIAKEDFVLEYRGELISEKEGRKRDSKYNRARIEKGSFMFYFKHNSKNLSIDATDETALLGPARLINHSMKNPNLVAKTIMVDDTARLFFCAKRNIHENEELLVDYGERDPEVMQKHPWLNS